MNPPPLPLPDSRRSSRGLVVALAITATLFACVLAAAIWHISFRVRNAKAIHRLEMKTKERGEPLSLGELAAAYSPVADEKNAAVLFLDLWKTEDSSYWQAYLSGQRPLPARSPPKQDPALPFLSPKAARVSRTRPVSASV